MPVLSWLDGFSLSRAAAAAGAAMRAVLWDLLLLCLFARARGDCRGDCLHCDRHLYRDSFDVLVSASACWLVPCHGQHQGGSTSCTSLHWVGTFLSVLGWGLRSVEDFGCWSVPNLKGKVPRAITVPPPWAPPRDTVQKDADPKLPSGSHGDKVAMAQAES